MYISNGLKKTHHISDNTNKYRVIQVPYHIIDLFFNKYPLKKKRNRLYKLIKKVLDYLELYILFSFKKLALKFSFHSMWSVLEDPFGWKLLLKLLLLKTKDIDLIFTTPVPNSSVGSSLIASKLKKIPIIITPAYHFSVKLVRRYLSLLNIL